MTCNAVANFESVDVILITECLCSRGWRWVNVFSPLVLGICSCDDFKHFQNLQLWFHAPIWKLDTSTCNLLIISTTYRVGMIFNTVRVQTFEQQNKNLQVKLEVSVELWSRLQRQEPNLLKHQLRLLIQTHSQRINRNWSLMSNPSVVADRSPELGATTNFLKLL